MKKNKFLIKLTAVKFVEVFADNATTALHSTINFFKEQMPHELKAEVVNIEELKKFTNKYKR